MSERRGDFREERDAESVLRDFLDSVLDEVFGDLASFANIILPAAVWFKRTNSTSTSLPIQLSARSTTTIVPSRR